MFSQEKFQAMENFHCPQPTLLTMLIQCRLLGLFQKKMLRLQQGADLRFHDVELLPWDTHAILTPTP